MASHNYMAPKVQGNANRSVNVVDLIKKAKIEEKREKFVFFIVPILDTPVSIL